MASLSSGSRCAATGASADAHGASTSFTRAEVAARAAAGASVFVVDGDVIDFGGFAHPGGHAILRRHAGEDVSVVFHGKQAGEGRRYAHSDGARRMLRRLRVGTIADESRRDEETKNEKKRDDPTKPTETKTRASIKRERAESHMARGMLRDHRVTAGVSLPRDDRNTDETETETDRAPSSVGSDDDASHSSFDEFADPTRTSFGSGADLREPLFKQVGALGARGAYKTWVYEPESAVRCREARAAKSPSLRFFESATLEFFSKSPWYLVPLTWVPVALASMADGWGRRFSMTAGGIFRDGDGDVLSRDLTGHTGWNVHAVVLFSALFAFVAGYKMWSAMEYVFHRFVFHHVPSGRLGAQLHFLAHGCHHKAPADILRLTFPPAAAAPVIFFFRAAFFSVAETAFGKWSASGDENKGGALESLNLGGYLFASFLFSGCLLGYVAYDCTHFALHVLDGATLASVDKWLGTRLERKKSAHLRHHFVDHSNAFGISSERWDRVMGTEHVRDGRREGER